APAALRVRADLADLPFRRHAFAGAWASRSYVHLPGRTVPAALADLHRSLSVGAPVELVLFEGDEDHAPYADDDFPGRRFSFWTRPRLDDVLAGAGFAVDGIDHAANATGRGTWFVHARRARTLADTVGPGMRVLVCGLNPSLYAADRGVGFARPGNRFWPAALAAGLVSVDRDPLHALVHHGLGMTDLVKRATVSAAELQVAEYREGLARVERLVAWLRPAAVCFVGLAGWRAAVDRRAQPGPQPDGLAGVPVYLMPSTSGLNARTTPAAHVEHLRRAASLAGR